MCYEKYKNYGQNRENLFLARVERDNFNQMARQGCLIAFL